MSDEVTPRAPKRPLIWPDVVLDLRDLLHDIETPIYIVGGAVRDAYLHRPVKDLDLAVPTDSIALARTIANRCNGDIFVMDAERGVARVLLDAPYSDQKLTLDVAQFRGNSLLADLQDRDFTVNAMAVDLHHDLSLLIDPLRGMDDIEAKRLRACTTHAITDDPIRGLRAVRQSVQLNFRIESDTLRAIRAEKEHLTESSWERIRDEFVNMLALPQPTRALRVADMLGLLELILPEISFLREHDKWEHTLQVVSYLGQIAEVFSPQRSDSVTASFAIGMLAMQVAPMRDDLFTHVNTTWANKRSHRMILILGALLHECGIAHAETAGTIAPHSAELAEQRAITLRLSNDEKQRLMAMIRHMNRVLQFDEISPLAIHRFWYQLGVSGIDVCLLALADYLGTVGVEVDQEMWLMLIDRVRILLDAYYNRYDELVVPPLLVDGEILKAELGLPPSPLIGELLTVIREAQVTASVHTVEDALALALDFLANRD